MAFKHEFIIAALIATCGFYTSRGEIEVQKEKAPKAPNSAAAKSNVIVIQRKKSPVPGVPDRVLYISGFLIEISKADRPLNFLSLRQPIREKEDLSNLLTDVKTGRPIGFKLISLDF